MYQIIGKYFGCIGRENLTIRSMTPVNSSSESQQPLLKATHKEKKEEQTLSNPIRPTEFQAATAIPFTSLFVVLMILLAVLFAISRSNGESSCAAHDITLAPSIVDADALQVYLYLREIPLYRILSLNIFQQPLLL